MANRKKDNGNGRRLATPQSVDQAVKSICDIMRRGNCAGAMQYVPELTWILFLRILDEKEHREEQEAEALGVPFSPSLVAPFRWRDWAAPPEALPKGQTNKRVELQNSPQNAFFNFVNTELLPNLKGLKNGSDASPRQKVISEIMTGVERVRIDTERNFLDVLDKVHQLTAEVVDPTHVFTLSQVYEGLLLKMGEKGNDGGQFFTPRQVIKAMVQVIDPKVDETIYDPGCGTGGFLAQSFEHIAGKLGNEATADQLETLKQRTFWGREKENLIYPIALANLVLHGIDKPNLWHGNTLTGQETYGGLFEHAPQTFDVILTNPPFGGKEGKEAQTNFDYKTGATDVLFLQHVIRSLRDDGRCGIVFDEGLMFRTNEDAFVKTNLLFFTKGQPTRKIWYFDLSELKIRKKIPLMLKHFEDFLRLLPTRSDSELSWTVDMDERKRFAAEESRPLKEQSTAKGQQAAQWTQRVADLKKSKPSNDQAIEKAEAKVKELTRESRDLASKAKEIEDAVYDIKAVNPNKKPNVDTRTPEDLMNIIEAKGKEITDALAALRGK
jgi:type I restriction enzyme M protein